MLVGIYSGPQLALPVIWNHVMRKRMRIVFHLVRRDLLCRQLHGLGVPVSAIQLFNFRLCSEKLSVQPRLIETRLSKGQIVRRRPSWPRSHRRHVRKMLRQVRRLLDRFLFCEFCKRVVLRLRQRYATGLAASIRLSSNNCVHRLLL